ncbi:MFS transporter [Planococcus liqunii]|uniref:MFS transporter n=1 Tax=Planococcus liqunii TaxID=3058394 RepID=UPI002606B443|nr:MFS transporter [Planococcus sp. N056]WKA52681.1 MFS transporter [Planococcus sp. N056]
MYRNAVKNKNVLYYLAGAGISQLGNVLAGLAFLFIAYELTESAGLTSVIAISQAVPYLLFGLIGGAVADRVQKKRLLLWIDLIRVPIILSLVVFYQFDMLAFWHLLIVSFVIQSLGCFYNPAYRAVLPLVTPADDRTTVNSLLDTVTRGVQVLTPIFSIDLLNAGQTIHFYSIDALTYALSALFILKIYWVEPLNEEHAAEKKRDGIFQSIVAFFVVVKDEGTIKNLFMVTFLMVFFNTWVWQVGLLLLLLQHYPSQGEEFYSLLLGWYGIGVILINVLIPFFWKKLTISLYLAGSLVWGMGILVLGFATHLPLYFLGVLIAAVGLPISSLSRVYLIQTLVPAQKLGRAFSSNAVFLYGSNAISLMLFGALASFIEISAIFLFCGSMMVLCAVFYLIRITLTEKARRKSVEAFK